MKIDRTLVNHVIEVAKEAGKQSLVFYYAQDPIAITTKSDNSPVTAADLEAHRLIKNALEKMLPGVPVLSEEDPEHLFEVRKNWQLYWLIDPIDGTREFISHSGQFTVNIALIHHNKPILGVVYLPLKERTYAGAIGVPSFREENGKISLIKVKPFQPGDGIILLTTRKQIGPLLQEQLAHFGPVKMTYRSSSVKFCLIAEGRADIYLRKTPIQEWDTGAGQAVIENAGGVVLDSQWQALRYNTKPYLLNSPFIALGDSKQLLPILKKMPMFEEI